MLYGEVPEITVDEQALNGWQFRVHNPEKTAVLRLPSAREMYDRLAQQTSIRRMLGRRKSTTDFLPNPKADLALFTAIRQDQGEAFDADEAAAAIGRLTRVEVTDCTREGDQYRITLKTPFGDTVHWLSIPLVPAIMQYRRTALVSVDLPHNQEQLKYPPEPPVTLYDGAFKKVEGYAESFKLADIPPHHKSAVVVELVQAVDELDADFNPN